MKKLIGILCISYPIIIWVSLLLLDLEYFWYFYENYKIIDLIYSLVSLFIFGLGLNLINVRVKHYLLFIVSISFVFYQTAIWGFSTDRYIAKQKINSNLDLVLVSYNAGDISTHSVTNLESSERVFPFFIKKTIIKSYDDIKSGEISLWNDSVNIDLTTSSEGWVSERFILNDLISN